MRAQVGLASAAWGDRTVAAAVLGALVASCEVDAPPAEGHVVVHIDTDAPLPRAGPTLGPFEAPALVDTVRIEITRGDGTPACQACVREFALTEQLVDAGASFTVRDAGPPNALLHAVAFAAGTARSAVKGARIEIWASLPTPPANGAREVVLSLPMQAFGRPQGSREAPTSLAEGRPARPRARWAPAARRSCTRPPPSGAACVDGGAFWMGSPDDAVFVRLLAPKVVALSPFFLDTAEVSVKAFREGGGDPSGVVTNSGSVSGSRPADFCTFTPAPGPYDDYPVNCVRFDAAQAYCRARGGDLPTEAQREYAGSALVGLAYPWGREAPRCGEAVLARGPASERLTDEAGIFDRSCLPEASGDPRLEAIGFPRPIHRASLGRDTLRLASGAVLQDLAGNLAEWVADAFQLRGEPCWSSPEVAFDPLCTRGTERTIRGGSWVASLSNGDAWIRESEPSDAGISGIAIGFRCAYPGL